MSRRRYKNSKKRSSRNWGRSRRGKKTNLRWVIVLLLIILAGVIITKQLDENPEDDLNRLVDNSDEPGNGGGDDDLGIIDPVNGGNSVLPPEPDGITSDETRVLIGAAYKEAETGKIISARNKLNKILHDMTLSKKDRASVKGALTKLSGQWLFSKSVFKDDTLTGTYKVVRGDLFSTIAPKYKVPHEILMVVNGINDAGRLQPGNMKVVKGPFRVKIQLSKFNMDLYLQEQYVKSYKIGIGKPGEETPTGNWRLKRAGKSDKRPQWYSKEMRKMLVGDDPEYPLGARWIPITCLKGDGVDVTGIALHGTNDPKSIGTRCSLGCIRLRDEDVIEVYNVLAAGISLVDIYE